MNNALPICEWKSNLQWIPVRLDDFGTLESSDIVGAYLHPMNSQSSCIAYCESKEETQSILVQEQMCICIKGNFQFSRAL